MLLGLGDEMKTSMLQVSEWVHSFVSMTAHLLTYSLGTAILTLYLLNLLQNVEAGWPIEVDVFAGRVIRMGERYGVDTPTNRAVWRILKVMEGAEI